jgi:hypothetical protein
MPAEQKAVQREENSSQWQYHKSMKSHRTQTRAASSCSEYLIEAESLLAHVCLSNQLRGRLIVIASAAWLGWLKRRDSASDRQGRVAIKV